MVETLPNDAEDASLVSKRKQQQRAGRRQRLDSLHSRTVELFEEFDQYTQQRWATAKLLADHGLLQQSKQLAAHVQVLQDHVTANAALMGECPFIKQVQQSR